MKRVRIMLIAIAVLGTVGGALAFKARTPNQYCIAPITTTKCTTGVVAGFTAVAGQAHYVITSNTTLCPNQLICTRTGVLEDE